MAKIEIKSLSGGASGHLDLSDDLFDTTIHEVCVRTCYNQYMANQRAGTHSTKRRGEVSGGGKKPWRQKGTGRARAGSSRSPLWPGGGITFGPKPRDYGYRVNKKVRHKAIASLLTARMREEAVVAVDALKFDAPKTKALVEALENLGLAQARRLLIVHSETDGNLRLSARNLPNVKVVNANNLNVFDLLRADRVLLTREGSDAVHRIHAGAGAEGEEEEGGAEE